MSFKDLASVIANMTPEEIAEAARKHAEGFPERQRLREIEFAKKAKLLEPSNEWYDRSYNI